MFEWISELDCDQTNKQWDHIYKYSGSKAVQYQLCLLLGFFSCMEAVWSNLVCPFISTMLR